MSKSSKRDFNFEASADSARAFIVKLASIQDPAQLEKLFQALRHALKIKPHFAPLLLTQAREYLSKGPRLYKAKQSPADDYKATLMNAVALIVMNKETIRYKHIAYVILKNVFDQRRSNNQTNIEHSQNALYALLNRAKIIGKERDWLESFFADCKKHLNTLNLNNALEEEFDHPDLRIASLLIIASEKQPDFFVSNIMPFIKQLIYKNHGGVGVNIAQNLVSFIQKNPQHTPAVLKFFDDLQTSNLPQKSKTELSKAIQRIFSQEGLITDDPNQDHFPRPA